jgi:hypothetical protein
MDGGPQSFDGVSPATPNTVAPAGGVKKHSGFDNVLGFLGDFLMSRLKMGTPYHDARENEKINAARLMDEQDPSGQYANLGNINAPLAIKLRENNTDNLRLQAAQDSTREIRDARLAAQKEAIRKGVTERAANYFNGLDPKSPTFEKDRLAGRAMWGQSATVRNDPELSQSLEELFPETYNPNQYRASIASTVPVSKQWAQDLAEQNAADRKEQFGVTTGLKEKTLEETKRHHGAVEGVAQQNADSRAVSANRPKTARAAKQSEGEWAQAVLDSGQKLTNGQKVRLKKYINGSNRQGASGGSSVGPTTSGW